MEKEKDIVVAIQLTTVIFGIINFFARGYVFMELWNWFPHKVLNAPEIGFAGALGLLAVIAFFKNFIVDTNEKDDMTAAEDGFKKEVVYFMLMTISIVVGFLIHLFV